VALSNHRREPGDELIVMAYRLEERFSGAKVAFATHDNRIRETLNYPAEEVQV
jgi:hypothetical protein